MKTRKATAKFKAMEKANQHHRAFSSSITLEDFLRRNNGRKITFRFEVAADCVEVLFTSYPSGPGTDDTTGAIERYTGYCMRFNVEPKQAIDNLMKYLREKPTIERVNT